MKQVLYILFIISLNTFSQSINIGDVKNIQNTQLDDDKNELYVFYKDSVSVIDLIKLQNISTSKLINPKQLILSVPTVSINSKIYFIPNNGGIVFRLDNHKINRIDNSFNHKMQINSTIFSHNDTIYRYGGYGFWSQRNFFTFFNPSSLEWDIVSPTGSKILPNGSQDGVVNIHNDDFYVYGGLTLNKFNPLNYDVNDIVMKFNIKTKSWEKLGKTNLDLSDYGVRILFKGKQIFFSKTKDIIILVDVVNNKLETYKMTSFQNNIRPGSFYENGVFYCLQWDNTKKNEIQLVTRNEDEFFGELISEEKFYHDNEKIYFGLGILLIILISIISFFKVKKWNSKRNRIITENGHLVYKRKILNFDDKSIRIIKLLLNSEKEIISKDIMEIMENPNLNYGHNTRVMNEMIGKINFKLKSTLGFDKDLITFKKSKIDKRIKVYSIDKSYFFIK